MKCSRCDSMADSSSKFMLAFEGIIKAKVSLQFTVGRDRKCKLCRGCFQELLEQSSVWQILSSPKDGNRHLKGGSGEGVWAGETVSSRSLPARFMSSGAKLIAATASAGIECAHVTGSNHYRD